MLGSVALTEGTRLVAQEQQGVPGTHSEKLLVSIDHLMNLAKWCKVDINAVAVAIGPGSFTGLRIGLGTAKGMALALDIPIVGVSSLESLALNAAGFGGTVVTLIDARRSEVYAAAWKSVSDKRPKILLKECVLPPDKLIHELKQIKGELLLVGDGTFEYGEKIKKTLGARAVIALGATCLPQAANLAFIAHAKLKRGGGDDLSALVPNYIRRSDAEIGFMGGGESDSKNRR